METDYSPVANIFEPDAFDSLDVLIDGIASSFVLIKNIASLLLLLLLSIGASFFSDLIEVVKVTDPFVFL